MASTSRDSALGPDMKQEPSGDGYTSHGWRETVGRLRLNGGKSSVTTLSVLIGLCVIFSVLAPGFFSVASVLNILDSTAVFFIVAIGETLIMIAGGIDLSVGSMVGLGGMTSGLFMSQYYHNGGWIAVAGGCLVACLTGACGGAFNGGVISKLRLSPLIVTLGTYGAFEGFANLITNGLPINNFPSELFTLGNGSLIGIPIPVLIACVLFSTFAVLLTVSKFGRYVFAVGANREAARRAGINLTSHTVRLYALAGILAAFAGFLSTARFETASSSAGSTYLLIAIAAVVIGGTPLTGGEGSLVGTVLGAIIFSVLKNGFVLLGVSSFWQLVAVGAAIIGAVYVDELQRIARVRRSAVSDQENPDIGAPPSGILKTAS